MSPLLAMVGKARWLVLTLGLLIGLAGEAWAQPKLRGAQMGGVNQLPPNPPINLLNNGSLATWPNPNAILPNQIPFSYIAAIPLGDRLGYNGIVYDAEILPNLGFAPNIAGNLGGAMLYALPPIVTGVGPVGTPMPMPPVKAAQLARQRMMAMQMQQMRSQQMQMQMLAMQQAYYAQYQQAGLTQSYGAASPNASAPAATTGQTYQSTLNPYGSTITTGFGAGFQQVIGVANKN